RWEDSCFPHCDFTSEGMVPVSCRNRDVERTMHGGRRFPSEGHKSVNAPVLIGGIGFHRPASL
ncbi:hypothetical protein, partial [Bifidobacterium moukalabense]